MPSRQLETVLSPITQKLKVMAETADGDSIYRKRKAITAFFSYAAWRDRDGQGELLNILFRLFRAMVAWAHRTGTFGRPMFMWCHIEPLVTTLLNEESPVSLKQVIILASPYLPWKQFTNHQHLIQLWAAAASTVPYTNDIGQSVVDTLFRIANDTSSQSHIPVGMWSWLNKRPPLPPICWGRFYGSTPHVVRVVRALGDIEILKSYLLLLWSEREETWLTSLAALYEMRASLREDFSGVGIGHHRQDLLRRLDYVLGQLDLRSEHLHSTVNMHVIRCMKEGYGGFREVLLDIDEEEAVAIIRELPRLIVLFGSLTTAGMHRVSLDFYVCTPSYMSIVVCLDRSSLLFLTSNPRRRSLPSLFVLITAPLNFGSFIRIHYGTIMDHLLACVPYYLDTNVSWITYVRYLSNRSLVRPTTVVFRKLGTARFMIASARPIRIVSRRLYRVHSDDKN